MFSSQSVRVTGLISSAAQGHGRASSDRQYTYINGRPCNLPQVGVRTPILHLAALQITLRLTPQVMKAVNEVYKTYNVSQVPLAVLDFRLAPESVDINVSPDKRTVFVHSERNLIAALREALDGFYAPTRSSFAVGGASHIGRMLSSQKPVIDDDEGGDEETDDVAQNGAAREEAEDSEEDAEAGEEAEKEAAGNGDAGSDGEEDEAPPQRARKRRPDTAVVTLDTTTASWSPQKRSRTSLRSKLQSFRSSATPAPASDPAGRDSEPEAGRDSLSEAEVGMDDDEDEDVDMEEPQVEKEQPSRSSRASRSSTTDTAKETPLQRFWNTTARRSRQEEGQNQEEREQEVEVIKVLSTQAVHSSRRAEELAVKELPSQLGRSRRGTSEAAEEQPESQSDGKVDSEAVRIKISESQIQRPNHCLAEAQRRLTASPVAIETTDDVVEQQPPEPFAGDTERVDGEERGHSSQEVDDMCCGSPSGAAAVSQPSPSEREAVHADFIEEPAVPTDRAYRDEIVSALPASEATLRFDLEGVRQRWASMSLGPSKPRVDMASKLKKGQAASAAGVQNRDLASAEAALSRSIDKADFARMRILGQFNRGFIIAALPSDTEGEEDLYIIDQHASDEKYNFETLQRSHRIQAQALLAPKVLQLSAGDEITLLEHRDVVERNGFEIKYDADGVPGRRVRLCAVPVSRDTVFDESDLAELIHRINDGHDNPRTSKARAMFAMRACRRSVMIGTALAKPKMEQLVRNMGTIDQPWNCPHGRPTMRHLTTVEPTDQSGRDRIDWSTVEL